MKGLSLSLLWFVVVTTQWPSCSHAWTMRPIIPTGGIRTSGDGARGTTDTALHYIHDETVTTSPTAAAAAANAVVMPAPWTDLLPEPQAQAQSEATKPGSNMVGRVVCQGKYLLTGYIPVASMKCEIYKAYPLSPETGQVQRSIPLIVKFSSIGIDREYAHYQRLQRQLFPHERQLFVQVYDYIPGTTITTSASPFVTPWSKTPPNAAVAADAVSTTGRPAGLVMERGQDNLRTFIRNHGAYRGNALRQAMQTVIQITHALHSHGYVWTELKPENFVVTTSTDIKGIDLESIIPTHDWLQVYTAEACPPEFPIDEMYQSLPELRVEESFDVWGLGLVLWEIATGKPFYAQGLTDLSYIQHQLRYVETTLPEAIATQLTNTIDPQVASIITACLQPNPQHRPSCAQLLQHPYFTNNHHHHGGAGMSWYTDTIGRQSSQSSSSSNFGSPMGAVSDRPVSPSIPPPIATEPSVSLRQRRAVQLQPQQPRSLHPNHHHSHNHHDHVSANVQATFRQPNIDAAATADDDDSTLTENADLLCWRQQLTHVLNRLSEYSHDDPQMAHDLVSILQTHASKTQQRVHHHQQQQRGWVVSRVR